MTVNRVGDGAIGVVGLYTLGSALAQLPTRVQFALAMPALENAFSRLGNNTDLGTVSLSMSRPGLLLVCALTLLPGLFILLARRRLASWLIPDFVSQVGGLNAQAVLQMALVLLGCYFVVVGLAGLGEVRFTHIAVGDSVEVRSLSGIARSLIQAACGIGLCVLAPPLARRLSASGSSHEGA